MENTKVDKFVMIMLMEFVMNIISIALTLNVMFFFSSIIACILVPYAR
jgi:hypothetical protein